jgi:hypothetical protein
VLLLPLMAMDVVSVLVRCCWVMDGAVGGMTVNPAGIVDRLFKHSMRVRQLQSSST